MRGEDEGHYNLAPRHEAPPDLEELLLPPPVIGTSGSPLRGHAPRPARWRACRRPSLLARPSRTAASSLGCHRVYWGGKNIQTTPIGYVLYGLDNAKQRQTKSTKIHIRVLISSGDIRVWPRRWPTASAFKNGKQAERLKEGREGGLRGQGGSGPIFQVCTGSSSFSWVCIMHKYAKFEYPDAKYIPRLCCYQAGLRVWSRAAATG